MSTFYFSVPTENDAAAARVRLSVQTLLNGGVCNLLHNTVLGNVQQEVDQFTYATGQITNTFSVPEVLSSNGYGGGGLVPPATAALIHLQTSIFLSGRRLRGRIFVSPMANVAIQADGTLDETAKGVTNVALANFLGTLAAGDNLCVWHRPKLGAGGGMGFVTSATVADKLAVLTSRRD